MFQKISAFAAGLRALVNKVDYVFKILIWATEALRTIADIFDAFPRPAAADETKNDIPKSDGENPGAAEQQSGQSGNIAGKVEGENKPVD